MARRPFSMINITIKSNAKRFICIHSSCYKVFTIKNFVISFIILLLLLLFGACGIIMCGCRGNIFLIFEK